MRRCDGPDAVYSYRIDEVANLELIEAGDLYVSYFARLGEYEKGLIWSDRFYEAYLKEIDRLKVNPLVHPQCSVYPFDCIDTGYRSFTVGWFTVFYTVEETTFTVWHIRSSKSDFTSVGRR